MEIETINNIFNIIILVFSVMIHEVAHGFAAGYFGDLTAKYEGRLTLNPIKHLDPIGSIILPFLLIASNAGFVLGWAKPVPYNPDNLRNRRLGTIAVASAGVLTNFLLALFFGLLLRFSGNLNLSGNFFNIISLIVVINLALGIFNLVPIPPLDGSKILFELFPFTSFRIKVEEILNNYGFIILLLFIIYFADFLYPILFFLYKTITGLPL